MSYYTFFEGKFNLNKPLDDFTYDLLYGISVTRRVARNVDPKYGVDGEFFTEDRANFGQNPNPNKILPERVPKTQPGLWCFWEPSDDKESIIWNETPEFYNYVQWIKYLIEKILAPRDYILNGQVKYQGEKPSDGGVIQIIDNNVKVIRISKRKNKYKN